MAVPVAAAVAAASELHSADGAQALLESGIAFHQAGRFAEAEADYRSAVARRPGDPMGWRLLGLLAQQTGHGEIAIELLNQALARDPNDAESHFALGNVMADLERLADASSAYHAATRLDTHHLGAWTNLSAVLRRAGQRDVAWQAARRALALAPTSDGVRLNAAIAAIYAHDVPQAVYQAGAAVALAPGNVDPLTCLADAQLALGNFPAAIQAFRWAARLTPDRSDMINNLGFALMESGDDRAAEPLFHEALRLRPDDAEAANNLSALQVARLFREIKADWLASRPAPKVAQDLGGFNPADPILVDDMLSPDECRWLVDLAAELSPVAAGIGQTRQINDQTIRRSNVRWVRFDQRTKPLYARVIRKMLEAADERFGFPLESCELMQLGEYDAANQGFFDWHIDTLYYPRSTKLVRRLTIAMQVTAGDDYDGGGLQARTADGTITTVPRRQGLAVIFPSSMPHRVDPVTRGRRYSLVLFVHGPYVDGC